MLDYGILTGEDLDLMIHGSELPNLGPNLHSPEALLAAVDRFSEYNAGTEAGARLLTPYTMPEEICDQQEQTDDEIFEEELLDADGEFKDLQGLLNSKSSCSLGIRASCDTDWRRLQLLYIWFHGPTPVNVTLSPYQ
ncbi:hypothetical protein BD769DRAFT_1684134 [Suillus cothurnatus]|nr:hypothetical protein BD769DRAFT_1684134 [Suillus cothurnatus]